MRIDAVGLLRLVVAAATMFLGMQSSAEPDPKEANRSPIRIAPLLKGAGEKGEAYAYSLRVQSPWPGGGHFTVNYPEHLEYGPVGFTITRYSDPRSSAWKIEKDGKLAHYAVDSIPGRGVQGVKVESRVEVVEPDKLTFRLKITNGGEKTLKNIKPLLCFQYVPLTSFPRWEGDNFKHTYVVRDGKITALADIPTEKENPRVIGAFVKGIAPYRFDFAKKNGGYVDKPLDLGLSVVTSTDGKGALIIYTPVGRSLLSNRGIPCLHADPHFGHLKPGASKARVQHVIFAGEGWRDAVKKIVAEHEQDDG